MATDREKILQAAQKYADKRRYDKAIEEYQKIIKQDPRDARTLLKIGDLQARMQAYGDAIATYDKVGQHYASQGFALKAIAVYKQVRELIKKHAPELAERYAHVIPRLADIYTQLGLTGDALATYDEVATHHLKNGRDREAIDVFGKMVELDPSNPLPRLRLAEACCRMHEVDTAIGSFWAAADLLLRLNRRDDALKVIERILHFRQTPDYARLAAELYLQRGTREDGLKALAKLNVCFQANPKDLETLGLLAQAFELVEAPTNAIEVHKEMARIAREQGRFDIFEQLVHHLRAVAPDDEQVRQLLTAPGGADSIPSTASRTVAESASSIADAEIELLDDDVASVSVRVSDEAVLGMGASARPVLLSGPDVVMVADSIPAAEELQPSHSGDLQGHAKKAVVDAESFRRLRLYSKAIVSLQVALEVDPSAVDAREKLRQVLEESGDLLGAANEAISIAAIHLEQGEVARATAKLNDALRLCPDHPTVLQMLADLGAPPPPERGPSTRAYSGLPPVENVPSDRGARERESRRHPMAQPANGHLADSLGPSSLRAGLGDGPSPRYSPAALPSYDLEGVNAGDLVKGAAFDGVDDPFADMQGAPLPSFPLGDTEAPTGAGPLPSFGSSFDDEPLAVAPSRQPVNFGPRVEPGRTSRASAPQIPSSFAPRGSLVERGSPSVRPGHHGPESGGAAEVIEAALEEAEFFAARGLFDDAKAILFDQLARTPNHPLLLERMSEVDAAAAQPPAESGTIDRSHFESTHDSDRVFDIAASLQALDALEGPVPARPEFGSQHDEVDVEQVFAKFKEGVKKQVAESDAATHYDLGVAYKEMGLIPDAISEFELAARDPERECMCFAMIGLIQLEQGDVDHAEEAFKRGLNAGDKTVDQEMSLYYDLGNVMEMKRQPEEALYYFKKIARRDPGFRDVKERIQALEPKPVPVRPSKPGRDEDEFDRVFDELFEKPKTEPQRAEGIRRR